MGRFASSTTRLLISGAGIALVGWALSADAHWAERHVLLTYCATNRAEWVLGRAIPWLAAAAGLAAVTLIAPSVARWLSRTSLRLRPGSLAGIAVAVAASLVVTEVYMRRLHQRLVLGEAPLMIAGRDLPMARVDSRLGWSYFPRRTTWVHAGDRTVAYAIDAEGDRAPSIDHLPDRDRPTILLAGESIAFGYGLPYDETLPFLVGRDLGVQVVNLAVVGYGNDQAHLRVLDALPRYGKPVAVVTLFIPNQIRRNVDQWRPRLGVRSGDVLELVPPSTGPRIAKLLQELPYRDGEALRVTAAIVRATAEVARARGAFPLFAVTNYGSACLREGGDEAWIVDELFVRQHLPFVRVDLGPEDRLLGLFENHPNSRGVRKIADAVERALSQRVAMRRGDGALEQP